MKLAVYGPDPVVAAYTEIARSYSAAHPGTEIKVQSYATHEEAIAAMAQEREKGVGPDVFLIDHGDLAGLTKDKALRRVDDLLGEREVDFGDGYSGWYSLESFSSDKLRCRCRSRWTSRRWSSTTTPT